MGRRKNKLDLTNDRSKSFMPTSKRLYDSVEDREWPAEMCFAGGVTIPFLSKPTKSYSMHEMWRKGKMPPPCSGNEPIVDNKGNYFEIAQALVHGPALKISQRQPGVHDFGKNEAAKTYYCQKKRIDTPAMNRVMDNSHEVPGETITGRVESGLVPGGTWNSGVERFPDMPFSPIGPGLYNTDCFEGKYGPLAKNFLLFSPNLGDTRGGDGGSDGEPLTAVQRRKKRNMEKLALLSPATPRHRPSTTAADTSSSSHLLLERGLGVGKFDQSDRWGSALNKVEKYVKTTGAKLDPDYDRALREREKVPIKFGTSPQRPDTTSALTAQIDVVPNWGPKADIATSALASPVKYSMAFRSKATVGMTVVIPTSGTNPGIYAPPSSLTVVYPDKPSSSFLNPRGSVFASPPDRNDPSYAAAAGASANDVKPIPTFLEVNNHGPKFTSAGTGGAGNILAHQKEKRIKGMYPMLARKVYKGFGVKPPKPVDPFAYLKPKIK